MFLKQTFIQESYTVILREESYTVILSEEPYTVILREESYTVILSEAKNLSPLTLNYQTESTQSGPSASPQDDNVEQGLLLRYARENDMKLFLRYA